MLIVSGDWRVLLFWDFGLFRRRRGVDLGWGSGDFLKNGLRILCFVLGGILLVGGGPLVGPAGGAVGEEDGAAVEEAVVFEDVAYDGVVFVGVGPEVADLLFAPVETEVADAAYGGGGGEAVDGGVGLVGVGPAAAVDFFVGGLFAADEGEGADESVVLLYYIILFARDVVEYGLGRGVAVDPLAVVAAAAHYLP